MKKKGEEMMKHCGGVPLAIVVLGGLLATKHTLEDWEMVHRNISRELGKASGHEGVPVADILALSYLDLPYHLKPCFLYFSNLPEDHDIRADTLVQMWAAEGIIIVGEIGKGETMMDVGMSYLGELVQRCMVQVQLTRYSKRIKLCRLHDLMRDMCLLKAKEENFVEVVLMGAADSASSSMSSSSTTTRVRRLALHYFKGIESSNYDRLGTINHHHIRSCQFYLFGKVLEIEEWQRIKSLLKGFKLLRVLYLESLHSTVGILPREIGNLIRLRYLGLTTDSWIQRLPSSIGNLAFLETLDLRSTYMFQMPNFLWKLKQLRHLYLPYEVERRGWKKLRLDGLSKLETLVNFDGRKFDVGCFSTLTNLRKLRVGWVDLKDLAVILESPIISNSNNLLRNSSIQIIGDSGDFETQEGKRLLREVSGCHHLHKLTLVGRMNTLPDLFPPNLTQLFFVNSELKEDPMPTLEKFPNLRSLLLINAYIEKKMVCSAPSSTTPSSSSRGVDYGCEEKEGGFPQLKYLCLKHLTNLEEWTIEDGAMPSLLRLEIRSKKLKVIPDGLRFVSTLEELEIEGASQALKDRLREGGEDFYKVQHVPSITFTGPLILTSEAD